MPTNNSPYREKQSRAYAPDRATGIAGVVRQRVMNWIRNGSPSPIRDDRFVSHPYLISIADFDECLPDCRQPKQVGVRPIDTLASYVRP